MLNAASRTNSANPQSCPPALPYTTVSATLHNLNLLRKAWWNAFRHGVFMMSKGAAYSSILTVFPLLIIISWVLDKTHTTDTFFREIAYTLNIVLPPGSRSTALGVFHGSGTRPLKEVYTASSLSISISVWPARTVSPSRTCTATILPMILAATTLLFLARTVPTAS